tara:strand:- start:2004 stop:2480 length:477 start_codon:yes stop_codon:yes gene_type:complete
MATTHEVRWSVSATPVAKETGDDGGHMAVDTLHENIRKSVGGNGTSETAGAIDFGGTYADGVSSTPYLQATSGGVNVGDTDTTFLYIKHTGYKWSSATVLGDATTDTIQVFADAGHIATLNSGESWIIPIPGSSSSVSNFKVKRGGGTDLAIEVIGFD